MPLLNQKNVSGLVFPVEILREFEINTLHIEHIMRFSGSPDYMLCSISHINRGQFHEGANCSAV